jgi:bifunctional UDP-N-acetylglucosamine pyrophosphorylase/glucosamine-1-phosphate N-acetyltransferase
VIIQGRVTLGDNVIVGPYAILSDAAVGDGTRIGPFTLIDGAEIGSGGRVGPYARLRPGTSIGAQAQIGNFVEIKNSLIGPGARINHHAFVGDATLGSNVTLGAGTITCNHDGTGTARTEIGDGAYIGSGTELVAPIIIGAGATIGAGSTITDDAPPRQLTVARARQVSIVGWKPRGPGAT